MDKDLAEKLGSLTQSDKEYTIRYFDKMAKINKLTKLFTDKLDIVKGVGFGNYNSKVMIIVDHVRTNDKIMELLKSILEINKVNFYQVYITSINKFNKENSDENTISNLNLKYLNKEINIIKPNRIMLIGSDLELDHNNFTSMSKEQLDAILKHIDDKENRNNFVEYTEAKAKFLDLIKFTFYNNK